MINLHSPLTDLPFAFFSLALLLELLRCYRESEKLRFAANLVLSAGVIGVLAAFFSGYQASELANQSFAVSDDVIAAHHVLGKWTLITALPCLALAWCADRATHGRGVFRGCYLLLLIASLTLIIATSQRGGALVFEHGAGVQIKGQLPLSLSDP